MSARKRPRRSSARGARGAPSIAAYFGRAPAAGLACPVCRKALPRLALHRHLAPMCAGGDAAAGAAAVQPGPGPATAGGRPQTSPYFESGAGSAPRGGPGPQLRDPRERVTSLGSLSSKLSRSRARAAQSGGNVRPASPGPHGSLRPAVRSLVNCPETEDAGPVLGSSSQEENIFTRGPPKGPPPVGWAADSALLEADGQQAPQECVDLALTPGFSEGAPEGLPLAVPPGDTPGDRPTQQASIRAVGAAVPSRELHGREAVAVTLAAGARTPGSDSEAECHSAAQGASSCRDTQELPPEGDSGLKNGGPCSIPLGPGSDRHAPDTASAGSPSTPYYLRGFLMVLRAVLGDEDDRALFNEQELGITAAFQRLSANGQKLYVRLFQRKPSWIRVGKLEYDEIAPDLTAVVEELTHAGFLQTESELQELSEALGLLSAPELRALAKTFHLGSPGGQRQQLVDALLKLARQRAVCTWARGAAGVRAAILKRCRWPCRRGDCVCVRVWAGCPLVLPRSLSAAAPDRGCWESLSHRSRAPSLAGHPETLLNARLASEKGGRESWRLQPDAGGSLPGK